MRNQVIDYLRLHPLTRSNEHYVHFVQDHQHMICSNVENAAVEDSNNEPLALPQSLEIRWKHYLEQLCANEWADHIVVQAVADLFNIPIHIFSNITSQWTVINPLIQSDQMDIIYVGLVNEVHYVILKPLRNVQESFEHQSQQRHRDFTTTADTITTEDATILHGDNVLQQISGGPSETAMFVEDPEAELQIFSVAPGQGHIPIQFVDDNKFEELSFPEMFCYGIGGYHSERATKLHWRRYFNQRLLDIDGRFAKDLNYLFVAQYIVESKQLQDSTNNFIWHQKTHSADNEALTAGMAKNKRTMKMLVQQDKHSDS